MPHISENNRLNTNETILTNETGTRKSVDTPRIRKFIRELFVAFVSLTKLFIAVISSFSSKIYCVVEGEFFGSPRQRGGLDEMPLSWRLRARVRAWGPRTHHV